MTSNRRLRLIVNTLLLFSLTLALVPIGHAEVSFSQGTVSGHRPAALPETELSWQSPAPAQTPAASPTPAVTASPSPAPDASAAAKAQATTRTIPELQGRIQEVLRRAELSPAMVAVKVVSLDTGKVVFEENANKLLRPASNMKLYTVATALDRLSPSYQFSTSVYAAARPDAAGIIHGDLTIYGRGDPSIAARFNNGDYFKGIDDLANRIVAAGVKRVEGDLVGDETYFTGPQYGAGWEWEDLQWWYGAEISALTINDNALDLSVKPGPTVGAPAVVTTGPPDPLLTIANRVKTAARGTKRELRVYRALSGNILELTGTIPLDDRGYTAGIGISHPALLFVYLLRSSLAQKGVTVTGQSRTNGQVSQTFLTSGVTMLSNASATMDRSTGIEIATLQSPPFSVVSAQTLKPSQNLYTELILRTLGKVAGKPDTDPQRTSEEAGLAVVRTFLKEAGVRPESLVLSDGSGLSRNDMITAEATVQLLTYMSRHAHRTAFMEALPIAGVDGTLKNRFRGTAAENNVRAKTGSLSSAASLSGYLKSAAGENFVFSIMVNNYPEDVEPRSQCIDPITVLLASFAGKS